MCSVRGPCQFGTVPFGFQLFTWPMMRDTSATYVDVKVFNATRSFFTGSSWAIALRSNSSSATKSCSGRRMMRGSILLS